MIATPHIHFTEIAPLCFANEHCTDCAFPRDFSYKKRAEVFALQFFPHGAFRAWKNCFRACLVFKVLCTVFPPRAPLGTACPRTAYATVSQGFHPVHATRFFTVPALVTMHVYRALSRCYPRSLTAVC